MKLDDWNVKGRKENERISGLLVKAIDDGEDFEDDPTEDKRSKKLADAVLKEVVALNDAGAWREARVPARAGRAGHHDRSA